MDLPPLITAYLIERYKRFIVKARLQGGQEILAHCPNTGSMQGCSQPGQPIYISNAQNPNRKLKYTWELIQMPASLVGINTMFANKIVQEALDNKRIKQLKEYSRSRPEVKTSAKHRIDFLLQGNKNANCYLEVKSCTWVDNGLARFPDARTIRGQKHLQELCTLQKQGHSTAILYLIQREDASVFNPASSIDQQYVEQLKKAKDSGTQVLAYDVRISLNHISLHKEVALNLA